MDNYMNYTPMKDLSNFKTNTIFGIPENSKINTGGIEILDEVDPAFRGKTYEWTVGPFVGQISRVMKMARKNSNYYIILDSGQMLGIDEISSQLRESSGNQNTLDVRPSEFNTNIDLDPLYNETRTNEVVPTPNSTNSRRNNSNNFDPVLEILKKKKKSYTDVNISLSLDIPRKELYDLLLDGYDDAEDKIVEYLFTAENVTQIKEGIKQTMRELYGN